MQPYSTSHTPAPRRVLESSSSDYMQGAPQEKTGGPSGGSALLALKFKILQHSGCQAGLRANQQAPQLRGQVTAPHPFEGSSARRQTGRLWGEGTNQSRRSAKRLRAAAGSTDSDDDEDARRGGAGLASVSRVWRGKRRVDSFLRRARERAERAASAWPPAPAPPASARQASHPRPRPGARVGCLPASGHALADSRRPGQL